MNCQYEICRKCPKIGIFKGTHKECEAFIEGTRCSNEPNAEFCYISSESDTINGMLWYEVKTNDIALYSSLNKDECEARNECEAFIKGIDYELKGRIRMEEKSNNLRLENDEQPVNPSSVETNDVTGYMYCDDENLNNEQLSWTPYYSQDDELRNNLKSVVSSDMNIDEKVNIIIALCKQIMVQVPTENTNPYYPPKVWYNSKPEYCTNANSTDATKPNPYMPYEYCSTQLKSATENDKLVYVPVGGTIPTELFNIIKDKLEHGIEYHECDGTRIDKKEYEILYNIIGHKYDDVGDNAEVSDFGLPNAKGWCVRIK
jgi:hypothetical protein